MIVKKFRPEFVLQSETTRQEIVEEKYLRIITVLTASKAFDSIEI
jgi:hypothetical protein